MASVTLKNVKKIYPFNGDDAKKKKKKKRTKPKKLVQITAELGTEVHVHILLQNQQNQQNLQNLQNLQHLSQRNLVLQEQILPQTTQQAMFGLIEEISTIYSIDYNNESAQLSTFFVHKKNRDHFPVSSIVFAI